ncbi:recombinase family protein [Alkaliphilus hydrothermalis]|uniref:DNA invertase Pin-like site-specific DNA recombinase n=1 Tax=Alkaliphilus hydrothermalis TaxID=1482730 RepID=A0ABS2NTM8_9FIRM|nr:recombinase family protein [Alkaliphilus hydrothermalis]MBM7616310.1 DNA invertase Pin-like site-specific DNA recombinase [Alkaliphilus hydrothermalis]
MKGEHSNTAIEKETPSVEENNRDFLTPYDYAAIYARKSIKTESHSIASQITRGKEVLNEEGLVLYNTYFDSESASRFTYDKRKGFTELLRDLESNKFKTVIVLKRDRLSRKFDELLEIKNKFKEHDIKVIYSALGEFQPDKDDCYSDFIENIIMGISELEPKILKDRTSNGIRIKKERGEYSRSGKIPFGFASVDDTGLFDALEKEDQAKYELFPNPSESKIVQQIFSEYVANNFETMSDFVNYVSTINNSKKKLTSSKITYMLLNPIYAGIQRPDGKNELFMKAPSKKLFKINEEKVKYLDNVKGFISIDLWATAALKYLNTKGVIVPELVIIPSKDFLNVVPVKIKINLYIYQATTIPVVPINVLELKKKY